MVTNSNGPVDQYLRETGKTREAFEAELKSGNPGTASIFAAEVLFGAIQDLIQAMLRTKAVPTRPPRGNPAADRGRRSNRERRGG